jgi:hypothetical protein
MSCPVRDACLLEKPSQAGERLFKKIPIAREVDKNGALSFYILFAAR